MHLIPFTFQTQAIRTVLLDDVPYFVAKDVAEALGYADPTTAIRSHCRGMQKLHPVEDALGRLQETRVISESDVLRLVISCNLPAADKFERWVFEEVLPAIRKTGNYGLVASNPYQLTESEAEQVAALGNLTAAYMAEITGSLHRVYEKALDSGVESGAASKYAMAIVNMRLKELEKFRKEEKETLIRAQKQTDKSIAAVSARLDKMLEKQEISVDGYLEKMAHAQKVLVHNGKQLALK